MYSNNRNNLYKKINNIINIAIPIGCYSYINLYNKLL